MGSAAECGAHLGDHDGESRSGDAGHEVGWDGTPVGETQGEPESDTGQGLVVVREEVGGRLSHAARSVLALIVATFPAPVPTRV